MRAIFSRALRKLHGITRNCDWFIALFAPVVIGPGMTLVLDLGQSFENRSNILPVSITAARKLVI